MVVISAQSSGSEIIVDADLRRPAPSGYCQAGRHAIQTSKTVDILDLRGLLDARRSAHPVATVNETQTQNWAH